MKIFVYVGLPKTATTFYQLELFPFLGKKIIYNPDDVMQRIGYFLNCKSVECITHKEVEDFHALIKEYKIKNPEKNLFIVNEHLGYNGIHPDPKVGSKLTKLLFREAEIIISLRYQTDWLLSSYMHHMDIGGSESIEKFLNFDGNKFRNNMKKDYFDNLGNSIRRLDVNSISWDEYIGCFIEKYSNKNIHILFFENFKINKIDYTTNLLKIIGWNDDIPNINFLSIKNRGRSAFVCQLTVYKCHIFSFFRIRTRSIVKWNETYSKLTSFFQKKKKNKFNLFLYYLSIFFIIIRYASWQFFMTRIDRVIYINWDSLKKNNMRKKLNEIFKKKNLKLYKYIDKSLIPKVYTE